MNSRHVDGEGDGRLSGAVDFLRVCLVGLAPPLLFFAAERFLFASLGSRWLLMIAAVIVSAANGGMLTGLIATIMSGVLVWWYLIPPVKTLGATDSRYYLSFGLFLAIGYAISLLHERLRRTSDGLARAARQNMIFAALIDNSVDFIGIADPEGNPRYLNPAGRRMVEFPEKLAIEHTHIDEYYPPELRAFAQDTILANMLAKDKWAGETSFRNWRSGKSIPVLDTHFLIREPVTRHVIGMATITRDISAQKAQRDALEKANAQLEATMYKLGESQRFLQGLLDYSPNVIVIKSVEGRYLVVNHGFREITRLGSSEVLGKTDTELFSTELAQRIRANDDAALTKRAAVVSEESIELHQKERTFLVTKFPLFDGANKIFALCGIWTDITTLKELQRQRDEWTSVIAHDLRQPIAAILMASDFMSELCREKLNDKELALVDRIHSAAQSLRRMVDDLLDMSLLDASRLELQRRWTDPRELVRGTLDRLAHLPGIERVHVHADRAVSQIEIDPMRIEQVVTNLVSNAIKYGDEHSEIIVQLEQRDSGVRITVTNHGRGIASDELSHLFNRFARSTTTRGSGVPGLGLGLYIARGVVEAHGGRLWATSIPGETTTFYVDLPVSTGTPKSGALRQLSAR